MKKNAIVMAAGKGSRMKSEIKDLSKVCFPILGKAMISYVLDEIKEIGFDKIVTVVGQGGEKIKSIIGDCSEIVWQKEAKGTADAISKASEILGKEEGIVVICCGDAPLISKQTINALINCHEANHYEVTVLTAKVDDPRGKGRIIKENGSITKILDEKDCSPNEAAIHEINTGFYVFNTSLLFASISEENRLSAVINNLIKDGKKVGAFLSFDQLEAKSVNDRYELSLASKEIQRRINKIWMLKGVTIEDPDTTYISPDVEIGKDTVIRPNTFILGKSSIGKRNILGPGSYFENVVIGDDNQIQYCHLCDSTIENETILGPYLRTRKGTIIRSKAHIGNFNELKNVDFGMASKAAHLSYLGDATIGERVNIGCGTIIANYDGVNKWHSQIGNDVFLGSGSTIISPVTIEDWAFVAAGSTITDDVHKDDMAIARSKQTNKEGYAKTLRKKAQERKKK